MGTSGGTLGTSEGILWSSEGTSEETIEGTSVGGIGDVMGT